jgi:hypothetical protein
MQATKVIDVKRSFVPVDPNSFPENYHYTQKEDSPNEPAPIVPYMGHNFLPTAYGYRSYFGTNQALDADPLIAEADYVFLFQNLAYSNTLIALTNTGVYAKLANVAGAWTQIVALAAPGEGIYYEWFYAIIRNRLYVFRGNGDAFYEIATDVEQPLGIVVATKVPNFITISAQLGMFRLGSRLGFWDATNAIAYGSLDDVEDFVPNPITGANVTTFTSVVGKISNIRPHGKHCVCYASKSVTLLEVAAGDTFMLKATPIVEAGVPYAKQSIETVPSTVHFCYSTTGIYKIENGQAEAVVPEVFDYFKPYTSQPVYLKFLAGRYLTFEILDEDALAGNAQFSNTHYPETTLTFEGAISLTDQHEADPAGINWCNVLSQLNSGKTAEQKSAANDTISGKKPGTDAEPIWTCYLANGGLKDLSNLTWDSNPCGFVAHNGAVWDMSPNVDGNMLGSMTTDGTGKTAKTGEEAWTDGKWTMERFVQVQTAIWEMEEELTQELLNEIISRAFSVTTTTQNKAGCAVLNPNDTTCEIGEFVSQYSPPQFGFNSCSFWLTRLALETKELVTKSKTTVACDTTEETVLNFSYIGNVNNINETWPSIAAAVAAKGGTAFVFNPVVTTTAEGGIALTSAIGDIVFEGSSSSVNLFASYQVSNPTTKRIFRKATGANNFATVVERYAVGYATETKVSSSHNEVANTNSGVLGAQTAWCEITGWRYTKNDGTIATAAATACTNTNNSYPGATPSPTRTVDPEIETPILTDAISGQVCNTAFVPPLSPESIVWPEQSVIFPGGKFLFQNGSIAPDWPTKFGALVYDTQLKKWGKFKGEYKQLLDYQPINSDSAAPINASNYGMLAGVLKEDGFIYLFDHYPIDSEITWGKIGFYRQGMTDIQEFTINFAQLATGAIKIDLSIDGKNLVEEASFSETHNNVRQKTIYPPYSGKWYNLTISGRFDVSDIKFNGLVKGRR